MSQRNMASLVTMRGSCVYGTVVDARMRIRFAVKTLSMTFKESQPTTRPMERELLARPVGVGVLDRAGMR